MIQEKFVLFMCEVIIKKLDWVMKHDIINRLIESFLSNYQKEETILRNGSNFVFDSVDLLTVHIHKINFKRGKSNIKSPDWLYSKRATINPKSKDNKCFQYSITVALNH